MHLCIKDNKTNEVIFEAGCKGFYPHIAASWTRNKTIFGCHLREVIITNPQKWLEFQSSYVELFAGHLGYYELWFTIPDYNRYHWGIWSNQREADPNKYSYITDKMDYNRRDIAKATGQS